MELKKLSRDLCRIIAGGVNNESMPEEIRLLLKNRLRLKEVSLFLLGFKEDYVCTTAPKGNAPNTADRILMSDPFIGLLKYSKAPIFRAIFDGDGDGLRMETVILDRMLQRGAEVSVPLLVGDEMVGFLNLGLKEDGTPLKADQIRDLSEFFSQIALVLQNRLLCENLKHSQAKMRRTDRLAILGTLTAGLAHEIRNPLVSIKTYFQLLPERYEDREFRERFQKVAAGEVDRISRLVEELLTFARPPEPKFSRVHIHPLIDEVLTLLESTAEEKGVELNRDFDPQEPPEILCDPQQIKQILINIAHNAFDAVDGKGAVTFRTWHDKEKSHPGFTIIEIEDNGVGMTSEEVEKLFAPFYTTKSSGTGLGLAISKQIVEEHLGSISVESQPGRGSTFYLNLPMNPRLHERRKERNASTESDRKEMVY